MSEKEILQQGGGYFDFMTSPLKTLANSGGLGVIFAGLVLNTAVLATALIFVGPSITGWMDSYNEVEKLKIEKSYSLNVQTVELLEGKVMPKLDDILKRLSSVETRTSSLELRMSDHDRRIDALENILYK